MTAGELIVRCGLDTSSFNAQSNQVRSGATSLAGFLKGAFQFTVGQGMFDLIQNGMQDLKDTIVGTNADIEQSQITFTHFLGSAEKANKYIEHMKDTAMKTPFQFGDLAKGSKLLMAFGFQAKELPRMINAIGDATAGLGISGTEGFERIGRALGQMRAKQKIMAQEMYQLGDVGINAYKYLADAMGVSVAQVMKLGEEGKITGKAVDEAVKVIVAGMQKDFGGMMKAQSTSFKGLMSTLKDFTLIGAEVFEPVFKTIKGGLDSMVQKGREFEKVFKSNGLKEAIRSILPSDVANGIVSFMNWTQSSVLPLLGEIGGAIKTIAGNLVNDLFGGMSSGKSIVQSFVENGLKALRNVLEWMANHEAIIRTVLVTILIEKFASALTGSVISGIGNFVTKLNGLKAVLTAIATFAKANPVVAIIGAIATVVGGIVLTKLGQLSDKIYKIRQSLLELQKITKAGISSKEESKVVKKDYTELKSYEGKIKTLQEQKNMYEKRYKEFSKLQKAGLTKAEQEKILKNLYPKEKINDKTLRSMLFKARNEWMTAGSEVNTINSKIGLLQYQKKQKFGDKTSLELNNLVKGYNYVDTILAKGIKSKTDALKISNIIKNTTPLLKERKGLNKTILELNTQIDNLSSLPINTLTKAQKNLLKDLKSRLASANKLKKINTYNINQSSGISVNVANESMTLLQNALNKYNHKDTSNKDTGNNDSNIKLDLGSTASDKLSIAIKKIKDQYSTKITNLVGNIKAYLSGETTAKKLNDALYAKKQLLATYQEEYNKMNKVDKDSANEILGNVYDTKADIADLEAQQKGLKTATAKAKAKTAKTNAKSFTQKLKDGITNSTASLTKFLNGNGLKIDAFLNDLKLNPENVLKDYDNVVALFNQDLRKTQKDKTYYENLLKGTTNKTARADIQAKINALEKQETDITQKIQDAKTEQVQQLKEQYDRDKGVQSDMLIKWTGLLVDSLTGDVNKNKALIQGIKQPSPVLNTNYNTNNNVSLTEGAVAAGVIKALEYLKLDNPNINIDIAGAGISTIATVQNSKLAGHR